MAATESKSRTPPLVANYAGATVIILGTVAWLRWAVDAAEPLASDALIRPMVALFGLTTAVGLTMLLVRNTSVIRGSASMQYYADYRSDQPSERIERPARTFNNLMQVPTLFYVVCLLMLATKHADSAQLRLAWTFVALRAAHALVYMLINFVPVRFAIWVASYITLSVMWFRFAAVAL